MTYREEALTLAQVTGSLGILCAAGQVSEEEMQWFCEQMRQGSEAARQRQEAQDTLHRVLRDTVAKVTALAARASVGAS